MVSKIVKDVVGEGENHVSIYFNSMLYSALR